MRAAAVLVVALLAIGGALGQGPNEITNLPGAPANLGYHQYAGYVTVDEKNGRNLFYWFVESQSNPSTDPLVLWLNGGPGCSSLEGLLTENGPLWVNPDGATLRANPSAWNQIANVVYLESPAGVGFSYSETPSDYTVGDQRTAADSVAFLHTFLHMYPQYQGRPFWVTGESYGGHYVPNLALAIVKANAAGQQPVINLAGFQVGNAWTDAALDNRGAVDMWWTHGMISDETHVGIDANCDFAHIGPLKSGAHGKGQGQGKGKGVAAKDPDPKDPAACNSFLNEQGADMTAINIYDIYTDVCTGDNVADALEHDRMPRSLVPAQNSAQHLLTQIARASAAVGRPNPFSALNLGAQQLAAASAHAQVHAARRVGDDPDPCVGNHLATYMNSAQVQAAINANVSAVGGTWYGCSPLVNYSYSDLLASMLPVYEQLLQVQPPLRMLVYSGDVDGIVPITGTRAWLAALDLPIVTPWHPWILNKQTGGWAQEYQGLTFASVRNAGHMVPWTEPARSYALFSAFLTGQPI